VSHISSAAVEVCGQRGCLPGTNKVHQLLPLCSFFLLLSKGEQVAPLYFSGVRTSCQHNTATVITADAVRNNIFQVYLYSGIARRRNQKRGCSVGHACGSWESMQLLRKWGIGSMPVILPSDGMLLVYFRMFFCFLPDCFFL
jgi:hypothetical protein